MMHTTGITTAFAQQWEILDANEQNPQPQHKIITDLTNYIQQKQGLDHEVILMIDANEQQEDNNSGIAKLTSTTGLIDIMESRHHPAQPTYQHAKHRQIDFMLATPRAAQAILRAGTLRFNDGIISDHRALYLDIDTRHLLGGKVDMIKSPVPRLLISKNDEPGFGIYHQGTSIHRTPWHLGEN